MYVVSFNDYKPPTRQDATPFTTAIIREGITNVFADSLVIDTFTLTPVDPNPAIPLSRSFTTNNAVFADGAWYWIVWQDASLAQYIETPFQTSSPSLSNIELLVRSEMPMSWDALAGDQSLGLSTLRLRIENVKSMLLPAVIAAADESSYSNTLRAYISKRAALDLIPSAIEFWMRKKTASSNTGTNETISYTDPVGALRELAKRLTVEVEMLAGNPGVIPFAQLSSDAPMVSNDGDLVTSDPNDWPLAFGVTSGTVTQT